MRVAKIWPCICIDHEPDCRDSVTYGMPQIRVSGCRTFESKDGGYRYMPYCPRCGRGGMFDFRTDYAALKYWNELQESLWRFEVEGLFVGEKKNVPKWRSDLYRKLTEE